MLCRIIVPPLVLLFHVSNEFAKSENKQHCFAQENQNSWDFSDYKRLTGLEITRAVINLVKPKQPQNPRHCMEGKVEVKILIGKNGKLINACAVSGHPILKSYAIGAVTKWKFKKNFGLPQGNKLSYKYAESEVWTHFVFLRLCRFRSAVSASPRRQILFNFNAAVTPTRQRRKIEG